FADLSPPAIGQGRAAWVSNNLLVAADLQSGAILWKQPIAVEALVRAAQFSRVAPAIAGARVCAGLAWEFNILDLASGARGAHEDATGGGVSASIGGDGSRCYFPQSRLHENGVTAVDPSGARWRALWSHDLGERKSDVGVATVLISGDTLYALTNHRVVAIDLASGARKWIVEGDGV